MLFPKPKSRAEAKRETKWDEEQARRLVYRAVSTRDGYKCRVCRRRCDPDASDMLAKGHHHHLIFRSKGGQDTTDNLALLCAQCHADVHAYRLKLEGNPDVALEFYRLNDDGWYLSARETSVGLTERD